MVRSIWRDSSLAARLAMIGLTISFIADVAGVISNLFLSEPQPGLPPGAQPSNPGAMMVGYPLVIVAAQVLVILGLRSRNRGVQTLAVAAAGLGCLVLAGVVLGISLEIANGGAPVWLGPITGASVLAGMFYIAAIVAWIRTRAQREGHVARKGVNPDVWRID